VAYVTHYPCINCAKILAAAGIAEVRYRTDYQKTTRWSRRAGRGGREVLKL